MIKFTRFQNSTGCQILGISEIKIDYHPNYSKIRSISQCMTSLTCQNWSNSHDFKSPWGAKFLEFQQSKLITIQIIQNFAKFHSVWLVKIDQIYTISKFHGVPNSWNFRKTNWLQSKLFKNSQNFTVWPVKIDHIHTMSKAHGVQKSLNFRNQNWLQSRLFKIHQISQCMISQNWSNSHDFKSPWGAKFLEF